MANPADYSQLTAAINSLSNNIGNMKTQTNSLSKSDITKAINDAFTGPSGLKYSLKVSNDNFDRWFGESGSWTIRDKDKKRFISEIHNKVITNLDVKLSTLGLDTVSRNIQTITDTLTRIENNSKSNISAKDITNIVTTLISKFTGNQGQPGTVNVSGGMTPEFMKDTRLFYQATTGYLQTIVTKMSAAPGGNLGNLVGQRGYQLAEQFIIKLFDTAANVLRTRDLSRILVDVATLPLKPITSGAKILWSGISTAGSKMKDLFSKFNLVLQDSNKAQRENTTLLEQGKKLWNENISPKLKDFNTWLFKTNQGFMDLVKKISPLGGMLSMLPEYMNSIMDYVNMIILQPINSELEKERAIREETRKISDQKINDTMANYGVSLDQALKLIYDETFLIKQMPYFYQSEWDRLANYNKQVQELLSRTGLRADLIGSVANALEKFEDFQKLGVDIKNSDFLKTGSKLYTGIGDVINAVGNSYKQVRDTMNASLSNVSQMFNQNFANYYAITSPNQEAYVKSSTEMIIALGKLDSSVVDSNKLLTDIVSNRDKMASDFFKSEFGEMLVMNTNDPWGIKEMFDSRNPQDLLQGIELLKQGIRENFAGFTPETATGEEFYTLAAAYRIKDVDFIRQVLREDVSNKDLQQYLEDKQKDRLELQIESWRKDYEQKYEKEHVFRTATQKKLIQLTDIFSPTEFVDLYKKMYSWDNTYGLKVDVINAYQVQEKVFAKFFGQDFQSKVINFTSNLIRLANDIFGVILGTSGVVTQFISGLMEHGLGALWHGSDANQALRNQIAPYSALAGRSIEAANLDIKAGWRNVEDILASTGPILEKYMAKYSKNGDEALKVLPQDQITDAIKESIRRFDIYSPENQQRVAENKERSWWSNYGKYIGAAGGFLTGARYGPLGALGGLAIGGVGGAATDYYLGDNTLSSALWGYLALKGISGTPIPKITGLFRSGKAATDAANAVNATTQTGKLAGIVRNADGTMRLAGGAAKTAQVTGGAASAAGAAGTAGTGAAAGTTALTSTVLPIAGILASLAGSAYVISTALDPSKKDTFIGSLYRKGNILDFSQTHWYNPLSYAANANYKLHSKLAEFENTDAGLNKDLMKDKFKGMTQDEWLEWKRGQNQKNAEKEYTKQSKENAAKSVKAVKDSSKKATDTAIQQGSETRKQIQLANKYLDRLGDIAPDISKVVMPAIIFFNKFNNNLAGQMNTYLSGMIKLIEAQNSSPSTPAEDVGTGGTGGGTGFKGYQGGSVFNAPITGAYRENRGNHWHNGVDFGAPGGTPLPATEDSVVADLEHNPAKGGGYGKLVFLKGLKSGMYLGYAHLSEVNVNRIGQRVSEGEMIGRVGNTGHSFGDHLHFMVGTNVGFPASDINSTMNPLDYLAGKNITVKGTKGKGKKGSPMSNILPGGLSRLPGFGWVGGKTGFSGAAPGVTNDVVKLVSQSESAGALDAVRDSWDKGYGKYQLTYVAGEFDNWKPFVRWLGTIPEYQVLYEHLKLTNSAIPATVKPAMTYLTKNYRNLWEKAQDQYIVKQYLDVLGSKVNSRSVPFRSAALSFSVLQGQQRASDMLKASGALSTPDDKQALVKLYRYALANYSQGGLYTGRYLREAQSLGIYDEVMAGNRKGDGDLEGRSGILYNLTALPTSRVGLSNIIASLMSGDYIGLRPFITGPILSGSWRDDGGGYSYINGDTNNALSQFVNSQLIADYQSVWGSNAISSPTGSTFGYNGPSNPITIDNTTYAMGWNTDREWGMAHPDWIAKDPSKFGLQSGENVVGASDDPFMKSLTNRNDWWDKSDSSRKGRLVKKGNALVYTYEEPVEAAPSAGSAGDIPTAAPSAPKAVTPTAPPKKQEPYKFVGPMVPTSHIVAHRIERHLSKLEEIAVKEHQENSRERRERKDQARQQSSEIANAFWQSIPIPIRNMMPSTDALMDLVPEPIQRLTNMNKSKANKRNP